MRPILRPGTHVLRRDTTEIQIGLDPHRAVILPADDGVRTCLLRLTTSADESEFTTGGESDALAVLSAHDLVLDSDQLLPLIPLAEATQRTRRSGRRPTAVSRHDVAALAREVGDDASRLLEQRTRARVGLEVFGNGAGEAAAAQLHGLIAGAGMRIGGDTKVARASDVGVLIGVGEPHRERADAWVREGTAHLVVRLTEGSAVLGPFVAPGQTACLRCLDAHHTDADPSWPLLVEQYARLSGSDRADGVPEPVDSLLASIAVAWAARDLASYAEGRRPSTWSTTIRFDPHLTAIETRSWLRHPACGCAWS